jgi:hypothetical protein
VRVRASPVIPRAVLRVFVLQILLEEIEPS